MALRLQKISIHQGSQAAPEARNGVKKLYASIFMGCLLIYSLQILPLSAQLAEETPLNSDFYKKRREALRELLPKASVAVFFASPQRNRSHDVNYLYHPDRNLFYLTGYKEPHSVLLIFKEKQKLFKEEEALDEILFTRTQSPRKALYDGPAMSPLEAVEQLGLAAARANTEFSEMDLGSLAKLEHVLIFPLPEDIRNTKESNDLYELISTFKKQIAYPSHYPPEVEQFYKYMHSRDFLDQPRISEQIKALMEKYPELIEEPRWKELQEALSRSAASEHSLKAVELLSPYVRRLNTYSLPQLMTTLREIKTSEEIELLRKAIRISCIAQNEVMRSIHPRMSEREVQGIHEFIYKKYGVAHTGYPSIVGSGHRGCVLHYIENSAPLRSDRLILMDLGAEYHGYTADVTRTIPINGQFNKEQRLLYEIVLKAQEKTLAICRPGTSFSQINQTALAAVAEGLEQLGLISDPQEAHQYLPHGVTHHIGLDVHDMGHYDTLAAQMVITIEPGIYVPENSPCEKKWWGLAIRIEDDILITENGYELLSSYSPRRIEDIEALMRLPKRFFFNYQLPSLDTLPSLSDP